jgi:hypothetical protein
MSEPSFTAFGAALAFQVANVHHESMLAAGTFVEILRSVLARLVEQLID